MFHPESDRSETGDDASDNTVSRKDTATKTESPNNRPPVRHMPIGKATGYSHLKRKYRTNDLLRSEPMDTYIEGAKGVTRYTASISGRDTDAIGQIVYVDEQMKRDRINLGQITSFLERLGQRNADIIDKITISHSGIRYSIGVLLTALSEDRSSHLFLDLNNLKESFHNCQVSFSVFGPEQRDLAMFVSERSYVAYDRGPRISNGAEKMRS